MNRNYFIQLIGFNTWADSIVMAWLDQINDGQWNKFIPSSFSSIRQTSLHIVSAEKIWTDFWENRSAPTYLSKEFEGSKNELLEIWKEVSVKMKSFITTFPEQDYQKQVVFRYPRGGEGQMVYWQSFAHCVNHSTYHRGQLVTLLRQAGFTHFSSIDLATYYRIAQAV